MSQCTVFKQQLSEFASPVVIDHLRQSTHQLIRTPYQEVHQQVLSDLEQFGNKRKAFVREFTDLVNELMTNWYLSFQGNDPRNEVSSRIEVRQDGFVSLHLNCVGRNMTYWPELIKEAQEVTLGPTITSLKNTEVLTGVLNLSLTTSFTGPKLVKAQRINRNPRPSDEETEPITFSFPSLESAEKFEITNLHLLDCPKIKVISDEFSLIHVNSVLADTLVKVNRLQFDHVKSSLFSSLTELGTQNVSPTQPSVALMLEHCENFSAPKLSVIRNNTYITSSNVHFETLQTILGSLEMKKSTCHWPNLASIVGGVKLDDLPTEEQFRQIFPKLATVGKTIALSRFNLQGSSSYSFQVPSEEMKAMLQKLRSEGKLQFDGSIELS